MEDTLQRILSELEMIRKMKMIEMSERGYSQEKIGSALGISQATVSRLMSGKKPVSSKMKASSDE